MAIIRGSGTPGAQEFCILSPEFAVLSPEFAVLSPEFARPRNSLSPEFPEKTLARELNSRNLNRMSIPEKHHFLPVSYLNRWASKGEVVRFVRPRGPDYDLHIKSVPPSAIAYERNLYAIPMAADPAQKQLLELKLYQRIDDQGAALLEKIDRGEPASGGDRSAFAQFVLSLPLRNPAHLKHARERLRELIGSEAVAPEIEDHLTSHVNLAIADVIQSSNSIEQLTKMKVFKIEVGKASNKLLTSDRPTMLSLNLTTLDGFVLFPYGPDRLIVLANDKAVVDAFSSQDPDDLVNAINLAVVSQAETVVIAADDSLRDFIDQNFMKPGRIAASAIDGNGMVRWRSPLTRLRATRKSMLLTGTSLDRISARRPELPISSLGNLWERLSGH